MDVSGSDCTVVLAPGASQGTRGGEHPGQPARVVLLGHGITRYELWNPFIYLPASINDRYYSIYTCISGRGISPCRHLRPFSPFPNIGATKNEPLNRCEAFFWGVGLLVNLKSVKPGRTHRFASQKKTVS